MAHETRTGAAVRLANSISFGHCAQGIVHVRLHDASGKIFAAAVMAPDTAAVACDQFLTCLEQLDQERRQLTAPAEGRA